MNKLAENDILYLRLFKRSDAKSLFELESDPEVYRYLHMPAKTKIEEVEASIAKVQQQYKDHGLGRLVIVRKSDEAILGWAGLKYELEIREFPYYDLGYRLKQKYWGKGYGTLAALLSLRYGFESLDLEKICGAADADNLGSNKILQKVGMTEKAPFEFEGIACRWYEMERSDWNQLKNNGIKN